MNRLYYGDCLTIMQDFGLAQVYLIYLPALQFQSPIQRHLSRRDGPLYLE